VSTLTKKEEELLSEVQNLQNTVHELEVLNTKQNFELEVRERDLDELVRRSAIAEQEQRNQQQLLKQRESEIQELQARINSVSKQRDNLSSLTTQI